MRKREIPEVESWLHQNYGQREPLCRCHSRPRSSGLDKASSWHRSTLSSSRWTIRSQKFLSRKTKATTRVSSFKDERLKSSIKKKAEESLIKTPPPAKNKKLKKKGGRAKESWQTKEGSKQDDWEEAEDEVELRLNCRYLFLELFSCKTNWLKKLFQQISYAFKGFSLIFPSKAIILHSLFHDLIFIRTRRSCYLALKVTRLVWQTTGRTALRVACWLFGWEWDIYDESVESLFVEDFWCAFLRYWIFLVQSEDSNVQVAKRRQLSADNAKALHIS